MGDFARVVDSMERGRSERPASRSSPATRKSWIAARRDGIFINTSGIGLVPDGVNIAPGRARPGDTILLSGQIAVHGIAIMSVREGLEFETEIASDTAPLNGLVEAMLAAVQRYSCTARSRRAAA